jgi:hypothetical protein
LLKSTGYRTDRSDQRQRSKENITSDKIYSIDDISDIVYKVQVFFGDYIEQKTEILLNTSRLGRVLKESRFV